MIPSVAVIVRGHLVDTKRLLCGRLRSRAFIGLLGLFLISGRQDAARGEAMLQLFNVNWDELIQKMPEIAEAGYTSLWIPPSAKAGSVYSVGYDLFDPFDLGDKNQRGTVRTKYGTKTQLLQVIETAHRFGIRVYLDNIMNHRGFDVPGYNAGTPTNIYPGLLPQDFHLQTVAGGYYANWPSISDFNNVWEVQNQPLDGLLDLANEPGSINDNFGPTLGSTTPKLSFVRQPGSNSYYMVTNGPSIGGPWRPFNGTNGVPVSEDVGGYLVRAAIWLLNETKCDGFRFDAVKHTPSGFFGDPYDSPYGYTGAIQTMFDYVHGYGTNVTGNGYFEPDDNRNSVFDTEAPRNDAMLFGEHLGEPPSFSEYLSRGMRLINAPYHFQLNNVLGNPNATLAGLDQRDYRPYGDAFTGPQSVLFAQSHDDGVSTHRELQNAYNFTREGLPEIYSDGYNQSTGQNPFPANAFAPYLGEFGDNKMPDVAYLHHQLARGGTRSRWSDNDIVAYERYDYREVDPNTAYSNPDATVLLFAMNDNYADDISFDDGAPQTTDGTFYDCFPVDISRGQGLVVGFPPGSVLYQLADAPNKGSACSKLLVRYATSVLQDAMTNAANSDPVMRKVYVGSQALAPGGGAIELKIPKGSYVMYGYQWPEASRASLNDAITLRQNGVDVPRMTVFRHDGTNGDLGFNPLYPFRMRGSIDPDGNVVGGVNVSNLTYAIDVPVITNAPFDIIARCDASAVNTLLKLDGGTDLNSQMGLGPTTGFDRRDNKPGYAYDMFLGYEQTMFQFRFGPEKFAAVDTNRNNAVSLGAETYYYTVGGTGTIVNGSGDGSGVATSTATWVYHDPSAAVTVTGGGPATQRNPQNPSPGQGVDLWIRVGYQFQINRCFIYYTSDGSNPEGSFGVGKGTTRVIEAGWTNSDAGNGTIDWWKGTIPASNQVNGIQIRYKIALFRDDIGTISDSDFSKVYGLNQAAITNFNPSTATVWLHNDLNTNNTATGLAEGFHILRARPFLPRGGKSSVFNTFLQTFYYDAAAPAGVVAFPASDGTSLNSSSYTLVIRADSSATAVECNISDSDPANDDAATGQNNGNGLTNGVPKFAAAAEVSPDPNISQQFPNLPNEFRFNYVNIPSSGSATITVRVKKLTSSVLTNRVTTLTRSMNTLAPTAVVKITNPPNDGSILILNTNDVLPVRACYTSTLTTNDSSLFSIFINGVLEPRSDYVFLQSGCSAGLRSVTYNWTNAMPGTNLIQVLFTNLHTYGDSRTFAVARPGDSDGDGMPDWMELIAGTDPYNSNSVLRITALANDHQLIVWDSVSNINYQVLATTNLSYPMVPISPIVPGSGSSTFYFDSAPDAAHKFYRIQVIP
jgi:hypothetical protein